MKIMAVDLGDARTGLAVCDRLEMMASPVGVLHEPVLNKLVVQIANAALEYDVKMLVVGCPINMDGTKGERAQKSEEAAAKLRRLVDIPVELWDERNTTVQATTYLNASDVRGKKRKDIIDEVAATIILESYLQYRKNTRLEEKA